MNDIHGINVATWLQAVAMWVIVLILLAGKRDD